MSTTHSLTLQITELDWFPPSRVVISEEHLSAAYRRQATAQTLIEQAEQQAAATLYHARQQAAALLWQSRKTCRERQKQQQAALAAMKTQFIRDSETEWIEQHVFWLIESASMERQLVEHVAVRINHCMKQVVTAWCAGQATEPLLIARLCDQVQTMAKEQSLTLRIHPQHAEQAQLKLGGKLQVVPDPTLAPDRGILSSLVLTVDISLSRHLAALQHWLCPTAGVSETIVAESCHAD